MRKLELARQDHTNPDFEKLYEMRDALLEMLDEDVQPQNNIWQENIKTILEFQDEWGGFSLLDSLRVGSDVRVDFCLMPTYICTAILMKAVMAGVEVKESALKSTLDMCCSRGLHGHGYESFSGIIEAVGIFMKADVKGFLILHPYMCVKFTRMFNEIKDEISERIRTGNYTAGWGDNFEEEITAINRYFSQYAVFVYGTLLKGRANHNNFLADSEYIGKGFIEDYAMYDLGYYPGIKKSENDKIKGELYSVSDETKVRLDILEGVGSLYDIDEVTVHLDSGEKVKAVVYVYLGSVEGCKYVPMYLQPWGTDYVWYVAYGSNMLERRLAYYIEGGFCPENGRDYDGCSDRTMPQKSVPVTIPHNMYYGNYNMGAWRNSAVSFIDPTKPGETYGRAYLVTRQQLEEIHIAEGKGFNWYPEAIRLDDIDGIPAYTFGGYDDKEHESYDIVSDAYRAMLISGMKETYPEMTEDEIVTHLRECGQR